MTIIILGDAFSFPKGEASTNRVYAYAKGLIENNVSVHVVCLDNEYMVNYNGIIDSIRYYHPFGQTKRSSLFIIRRWHKFLKYFKASVLVREINKKEKVKVIYLYTHIFSTQFYAFVLAKFVKANLIIERCEHPLRHYNEDGFKKFYGNLKLYVEMRLYDGIFCISNYLIDFYKKRGFNYRKLFLVPSTVDTGRFRNNLNSPLPYDYIMYCGGLTVLKDGVHILIESFTKISEKYPEINLVLIGKGDSIEDDIMFEDYVATLNMKGRIIFLGQLPRTDIPKYLTNAKILALARPQSIVSDAGFPSKLTEYLATGKPVVVTSVGDIPVYLEDNKNAFLSKPDSVDAFADKLDYVLSNYEFAQQVGEKGKELTETIFNYNFQAKRIIDFIDKNYN